MALAQYSELYWIPSGAVAASVPARVFAHDTNTLATLWADAAGTLPLANPLNTSTTGRLEFWAEEGRYWVHIDSEAFEIAVGTAAQPATQADLAAKVTGPATATDNAIARFDGTTGKLVQDSAVTIADDGSAVFTAGVDLNGHTHVHDILVGIGTAAGTDVIAARINTDTTRRLIINAGGTIEWSSGTTAPDTNLYRSAANTLATDDDLLIQGTGKAYRLRRGGSALDLEATGVDLLISNWSGTNFDGTQRSYLRLSADAQNVQVAGKVESVAALYGSAVHTLDPTTGVAGLGAKNALANIRFAGMKATAGAPTSGTWAAGDAVLDSAGAWYLCTADGTPGTWTSPSSGLLDQPAEQNLLAWTYDPNMAGHVTAQSAAGVAGRITLVRIPIRRRITWSNIWIGLSGVDAGATLSNCYLGVYDTAGNLQGTTADISSSLMSGATAKPLALAAPFTADPGFYLVAMLLNGTWTTNALTFKASGAGVSVNAGLSAPNLRYSNMLTGQTSLPATLNLASQSTSIINTGWASQWYGVS